MNYPVVFKNLALITGFTSVFMIPSLVVSIIYREFFSTFAFAGAILTSLFIGLMFYFWGRTESQKIYQREALALVGLSWIVVVSVGALPFFYSGTLTNPVDAFFESMSGFTTTGSTVIVDIEACSKSILFWRSMTQWAGGIGILVLFISVLPYLGAGGKQLFSLEAPGPESRTFKPHIRDTVKFILKLYASLTGMLFLLLRFEGMTSFDSICHAFTTVSTGGFSTKQSSIAGFNSPVIELTITIFMVIAAVNFAVYFAAIRNSGKSLFSDTETRVFLGILAISVMIVTLNLAGLQGNPGEEIAAAVTNEGLEGARYANIEQQNFLLPDAFRKALFQSVSIMTSTGFLTDDFDLWPHFSRTHLLLLMFIGGCAGSTAGGFKVIRIIMLLKMAYWRLEQSFRPHVVRALRVGDEVIEEPIQRRVSGFFVLYFCWFIVGTLFLSSSGLPFETATTAVLTTMNNIGPGLGLVGASMDFHLLSDASKLFLSFCMLLGRLEIFTLTVFLLPSFWRVK